MPADAEVPALSYASPVDYDKYGEYGPGRGFDRGQRFQHPRYRCQGRITADGSSGYRAEPGRYHVYISWGCPWAQRTAIVRQFKRLEGAVSLSYVDDTRDGRGWAFRDTTDFTAYGGLLRGPTPSFLHDASWRIKVEPHLADWNAPTSHPHAPTFASPKGGGPVLPAQARGGT